MRVFTNVEVRNEIETRKRIKTLSYPYRMFLAKAMEAHGCEALMERLGEALLILDSSIAFTDEERKEAKKLIYCDAAEMINKFNKRCGG